MKLVLLLILVFLSEVSEAAVPNLSQKDTVPVQVVAKDSSIYGIEERDAAYPGGNEAWRAFLEAELNPDVAVKAGAKPGTYTVVLQFIINPDGVVKDVRPLSKVGYGMEQEAVRVIKKSENWQPAIQNGRYVNAYRKQNLTFQVSEVSPVNKKRWKLFQ